jgi:hypothetical protein
MRESLASLVARAQADRWLYLAAMFHVIGVHWLSGARTGWSKLVASLGLVAVVPCWIKATGLSRASVGANAPTELAALGLVVLTGLWLFLGGAGRAEWLTGFVATWVGASLVLIVTGPRWPAAASVLFLFPLAGAAYWLMNERPPKTDPAPLLERLTSALAVAVFAVVILTAARWPRPASPDPVVETPRFRDLVAQPAILVLISAGAVFGVATSIHLWPAVERQ